MSRRANRLDMTGEERESVAGAKLKDRALSLRVFLRTPHAALPDDRLTREEGDDVVAYILSPKR